VLRTVLVHAVLNHCTVSVLRTVLAHDALNHCTAQFCRCMHPHDEVLLCQVSYFAGHGRRTPELSQEQNVNRCGCVHACGMVTRLHSSQLKDGNSLWSPLQVFGSGSSPF
jgi:hypothetical protein